MTVAIAAGAPLGLIRWDAITWPTVGDQVRRLQVRIAKAAGERSPRRATLLQPGRFGDLSKMLEPYDGKPSRTVLRGEGGREAPDLPGAITNGTLSQTPTRTF